VLIEKNFSAKVEHFSIHNMNFGLPVIVGWPYALMFSGFQPVMRHQV